MGRPKISFTGAGLRVARVRFNSRPILATFPRIAIIEAALYAKTCQYLYLNAVGDSFTTQVIGGILNKSPTASVGSYGHELCSV